MKRIPDLRLILFLLLFFFSSMFCSAQEDTTSRVGKLAELSLEELLKLQVYSPGRKFQSISEAPSIITVMTRSDIKKMGVVSLIDVLKYIPGIETSLASDGTYRVSIRGIRKEGEILMMINNQPVNNFYSGNAIFDIPVQLIDRIEVIRGPGSALFGTNAIAGVINIFTIKQTSIMLRGGTNNSFGANMNYNFEKNKTSFALSAGYNRSDGPEERIESDKEFDQIWSNTYGEKHFKTNRWNEDMYISGTIESGEFSCKFFGFDRSYNTWSGPLYITTEDSDLRFRQINGSASYNFRIQNNVIITPRIFTHVFGVDNYLVETPPGYTSLFNPADTFFNGKITREKYTGRTHGAELRLQLNVNDRFDIISGNIFEDVHLPEYEIERNYRITGDTYRGVFGNYDNIQFDQKGKTRYIFAYYIQGNYHYKKLNVTAGLRYDIYSDFGRSFNPRIGIVYDISDKFILRGLYGKAFRAPTFKELYDNSTIGNQYGVLGNPDLDPEIIHTSEIGAEFHTKRLIVKYNLFYKYFNNLIRVYDPHGNGSVGYYENIGSLNIYGHEAALDFILNKKFRVFVNYSQLISVFNWDEKNVRPADVIYLSNQSECDRWLHNFPTIRMNSGISYSIEKFNFFIGANYGNAAVHNNRFYLEGSRDVEIPQYLQGNFGFTWSASKNIRVRLYGNNIGTKYSDPEESTGINAFGKKGLIQPGATYLVEFIYSL